MKCDYNYISDGRYVYFGNGLNTKCYSTIQEACNNPIEYKISPFDGYVQLSRCGEKNSLGDMAPFVIVENFGKNPSNIITLLSLISFVILIIYIISKNL